MERVLFKTGSHSVTFSSNDFDGFQISNPHVKPSIRQQYYYKSVTRDLNRGLGLGMADIYGHRTRGGGGGGGNSTL